MKYLVDHWRGNHPLFQAFWLNLIALRGAVFWLDSLFKPYADQEPATAFQFYIPFAITLHVCLFIWQIVGTVRALDTFIRGRGAMYLIWGTQLGIALTIGATIVRMIASVQPMLIDPPGEPLHLIWERDRASKYDISLSSDERILSISGEFELGLSAALKAALAKYTDLRTVSLDSPGGRIYEGRAVAKVIEDYGLGTYVAGTCKSACATAFMAGKERVLGPVGRIGFHQYGDEARKPNPFTNLDAQQEKDRAYFARRGVDEDFLIKIFDAPATSIWFPTHAELLAANVVHRIGDLE